MSQASSNRVPLLLAAFVLLAGLAWGGYQVFRLVQEARARGPSPSMQAEVLPPLAKRGQAAYLRRCAACHHPDPSRAGTHGPDIQSSSLELLKAKVLRGEYPEGYAPKWKTDAMRILPLEEGELEAIHAFFTHKESSAGAAP
jgi:mono/diheme cytochrome c family protein